MVKQGYWHFSSACKRSVRSHTLPLNDKVEQPIKALSSDDSNMDVSCGPSSGRFETCARKYIVSESMTLRIALEVSHRRAASWTKGIREGVRSEAS